ELLLGRQRHHDFIQVIQVPPDAELDSSSLQGVRKPALGRLGGGLVRTVFTVHPLTLWGETEVEATLDTLLAPPLVLVLPTANTKHFVKPVHHGTSVNVRDNNDVILVV